MKPNFQIVATLIIFVLTASCKRNSDAMMVCDEKGTYFIFGRFCGECADHCATVYRLDDGCLEIDDTHNYVTSKGINFNGTVMTQAKFDKVKGLNNHLPQQLLNTSGAVFGSPDSHDQCGYYLETIVNGKRKIWLVDTDETVQPDYLKPFITEVSKALSDLK